MQPSVLQSYIDVVLDSTPGADPLTYKCCVPVVPQDFSGYLTLLRFPHHIKDMPEGDLCAVILDLSRVGGMYYACILPNPLPYEDLIQFVTPQTNYDEAPLRIFVGNSSEPHQPGQPIPLFDGAVLLAARPTFERSPGITAESIAEDPSRWGPLHHMLIPTVFPGVLVQYKQEQFYMPPHHHTGQTVVTAAARAFRVDEDRITSCAFATPGLELQGHTCHHLIAILDLPPEQLFSHRSHRRRDVCVLCDFRALGGRAWIAYSHTYRFHLPSLAAQFGIRVPRGCRLLVLEGQMDGDDVVVDNHTILTFMPAPIFEILGSTPGTDPPDSPRGPGTDPDGDHHSSSGPGAGMPGARGEGSRASRSRSPARPRTPLPWEGFREACLKCEPTKAGPSVRG